MAHRTIRHNSASEEVAEVTIPDAETGDQVPETGEQSTESGDQENKNPEVPETNV